MAEQRELVRSNSISISTRGDVPMKSDTQVAKSKSAPNISLEQESPETKTTNLKLGISRVLLIEDDTLVVDLLEDALKGAGYRVLVAKSATDGLELYRNYHEDIFFIVLDYSIPGMHPTRLIQNLFQIDPQVKILLSSGYSSNFIREDFPLDTVAGFIAKPFDPSKLIAELERLEGEKG